MSDGHPAPDLDREGPVPIYQQIRDWMDEQITLGHWPEHYKLPSEVDLAGELEVSRGTVRRAIAALMEAGKLVQIHGRGTFVSSRYLEQPLAERLVSFSEDLISKQIPFETQLLEQVVIQPPREIATLLAVPPTAPVLLLRRRRLVNGIPVILLHNYVVLKRCPGIEGVDFTRYRLFEAFEELFGLTLDWAQRSFEARVADERTAALLELPPAAPVLYMEQLLYLQDGKPVELSHLWLRGESFRLSATVSRHGGISQPLAVMGTVHPKPEVVPVE